MIEVNNFTNSSHVIQTDFTLSDEYGLQHYEAFFIVYNRCILKRILVAADQPGRPAFHHLHSNVARDQSRLYQHSQRILSSPESKMTKIDIDVSNQQRKQLVMCLRIIS